MDCGLVSYLKILLQTQGYVDFFFCFMFSSSGCTVLHFTDNTMNNLELIFNKKWIACWYLLWHTDVLREQWQKDRIVINDGKGKTCKC